MPTHFPAGPWGRAIVFTQGPEDGWQNDIWFKATGTPTSSFDIEACAAAFDGVFADPYIAVLHNSCTYEGVNFYFNNGTYTAKGETFPATVGALSDNMMPSETAAVVTASAAVGTRKGVGKLFFGGVAEDNTSDSRLISGAITAYNAIGTALKTGFTYGAVTFEWGIWSRALAALDKVVFFQAREILGHRTHRRPKR